jgi:hypothetical protein
MRTKDALLNSIVFIFAQLFIESSSQATDLHESQIVDSSRFVDEKKQILEEEKDPLNES